MDPWLQCSALKTNLTIKTLNLCSKSLLWIFSAASEPHPLFSAATAAAVVAVLYVPFHLLSIFFSPVLLSTLSLLFALIRYGSPPPETDSKQAKLLPATERCRLSSSQKQVFCEPSIEWGGPLDIIYEEYEGEEEYSGEGSPEYSRYGFCYSDSDMEGEEESPVSICFRWDEEAEGLIEIALEEDNMFEIDLSACREIEITSFAGGKTKVCRSFIFQVKSGGLINFCNIHRPHSLCEGKARDLKKYTDKGGRNNKMELEYRGFY